MPEEPDFNEEDIRILDEIWKKRVKMSKLCCAIHGTKGYLFYFNFSDDHKSLPDPEFVAELLEIDCDPETLHIALVENAKLVPPMQPYIPSM